MTHRRRRGCWLLVVINLFGCALVARGCVFRPATDYPGSRFNRGTNAVWLGVEWVNEPHTPADIAALAHALQQRQMQTVFVYTSYLQTDGAFNQTFHHAIDFIAAFKRAAPGITVLAWIGLPLKTSGSGDAYHVELNNNATRRKIVAFCNSLVDQHGFDGIHLDPEPVKSGNRDVLVLLEELRAALDPGTVLSIAGRRIWHLYPAAPWPLIEHVSWREDYYQDIARRVDQIAVMAYDSRLPLAWMYREWMQFEVISLSNALAGIEVELLLGIPTSEEETSTHSPRAENVRSALEGVIAGLNDKATHPGVVDGVAIYPEWETDADEWAVYKTL
jgi:hypothetical protein